MKKTMKNDENREEKSVTSAVVEALGETNESEENIQLRVKKI